MAKSERSTSNQEPDFQGLYDLELSLFILPRGTKIPNMSWKSFQSERPPKSLVDDWQGQEANVAIVTGKVSDILVIDVDSEEAQELVNQLDLPQTPTVRTGKGRHYYFRYPNVEVRNSVRLRGVELDVRGEGGYVVGAGSKHPDGQIYHWEISPDDCDFAELPESLIAEFAAGTEPGTSVGRQSGAKFLEAGKYSFWFNRELNSQISALRESKEGERNTNLFRAAALLANHVSALDLDWEEVSASLRPEALALGLTGDEVDATLASAWKSGSQTPTEWVCVAQQWLYIAGPDRFWSPVTSQELKPEAFSRQYAHAKPFEKGTFASFLTSAGLVDKVLDFRFEPSEPSGIIKCEGEPFFNKYSDPGIAAVEGDWTPFTKFLEYLVPDKFERDHLVQLIAWTLAHPGEKLSYALLLQSKEHGVGKSTLIEIWRTLLGFKNTRMTNSEEMDSPYQSYLENSLLVVLEELDLGSGMTVYNRLKAMITNPTAVINVKYRPQREVPNYANFVFLSNLEAPIFIEQSDRRFFVIDTPAERRTSDFWNEFHGWWRKNLSVIKGYFENVYIGDFEPKAHPPMTEAKERLMAQSETPLVQNLRELLADMQAPLREVCLLDDVRHALRKKGVRVETPRKLAAALKSLGCRPLGQTLVRGEKLSLWALRRADYWEKADHPSRRSAYLGLDLAVSKEEDAA